MSLFHSVDPIRHGVTTNVFTPQVRPVVGLAETLKMAGKKSAVFYTWEELKDITRPSSLAYSLFFKDSDEVDKVMAAIKDADPGAFINSIKTEEIGGWFYSKPNK
jgi:hypothetical protein